MQIYWIVITFNVTYSEIPLKIYRYIIVLTIFIVLGIGGYLYYKMKLYKLFIFIALETK